MPRRSRSRRRSTSTRKRRNRTTRMPSARVLLVGGGAVVALVLTPSAASWWHEHGASVVSTAHWAAPLALLLASAVPVVAILRRQRAVATPSRPRPIETPGQRNDGKDLERRLASVLRRDGYLRVLDPDRPAEMAQRVKRVAGTGDRGLDGGGYHPQYGLGVMQSKQYKGNVGSKDIQIFLGTCWYVIKVDGRFADFALFVTTADFTAEAQAIAAIPQEVRGYPRVLILVNGAKFARWEAGTWHPLPLPTRQEVI